MESIGGFGGKSDLLARNQVFGGDPNYYLKSIARIESATARQVVETSKKWLSDGEYVLRVLPYKEHSTTPTTIDRSAGFPPIGAAPEVSFDSLHKTTLSNGLKVILATRSAVPVVKMRLIVDAGFAADKGVKPGTANLTMNMLDEGTRALDGLQISTQLAQLGTSLSSSAGLDTSTVRLDTLKENLDPSLAIFSDVIQHPSFPESQLERLKSQQLAAIAQEKSSPFGIGFRILPSLLYGQDHAYSKPFSGSGDEASVSAMSVADLRDYHQTWFKADNATLVVAGDISLDELKPKLEKTLGTMPSGEVPQKNIAVVDSISEPVIYLVDRPGSEQSAIIAAKMMPKYGFDGELPLQLVNEVLGAGFSSRINMNLREDKGWAYGARSSIQNTQGQRPFLVRAPVQTDKTLESMQEIYQELSGIISESPATKEELARSLDKRTLTLPGRWQTAGAVESDIANMVRYKLSDDYWDKYVQALREIKLTQVNASAKQHITPDNLLWLVIGDLSSFEQKVRDAKLGKVIVLDSEGQAIISE